MLVVSPAMADVLPSPRVGCQLSPVASAAGQPLRLRLTLSNRSRQPLAVLDWGTPFEGWFQPWLAVTLDGVDVPYQGPMIKRGDPEAASYLRLQPGASRSKTFALAPAFDTSQPGLYRIEPRLVLADVFVDAPGQRPPRPRDRHHAVPVDCPALDIRVP